VFNLQKTPEICSSAEEWENQLFKNRNRAHESVLDDKSLVQAFIVFTF
jgi:hypothetical protein